MTNYVFALNMFTLDVFTLDVVALDVVALDVFVIFIIWAHTQVRPYVCAIDVVAPDIHEDGVHPYPQQ